MQRLMAFIPVDEDWYGNFFIEDDQRFVGTALVKVAAFPLQTNPITYRVCVWGNDDHGMELDVDTDVEALQIYTQILLRPNPTHAWLKSLGFRGA